MDPSGAAIRYVKVPRRAPVVPYVRVPMDIDMAQGNIRRGARPGYPTVARTRGVYGQGEMKYFDSFRSAQDVAEGATWAGTELDPTATNTLFVPQEGSAINQRIGRKVKVFKVKIRGIIQTVIASDQADVLPAPLTRLVLYLDQQTNSTQAQGEDVMATPGAATNALAACVYQNLANFGRFKVLKDKTYQTRMVTAAPDGAATVSVAIPDIPFKWNINYPGGIDVHFNATNGGTVADIVNNSWHIIGIKSSSRFSSELSYQCRVCYKE